MISPGKPINEKKRLKALEKYQILDTIPEKDYDDITRLAANICDVPVALVCFVDAERQWFKSRFGLENATETPREIAFCAHAINKPEDIMLIKDAQKDPRFSDNPLVTGETNIQFYAGVPLVDEDGFPLGTLCVIDEKPRTLTDIQSNALRTLANQVMTQLTLRKKVYQLEKNRKALENLNKELDRFAYVVSHDLKAPLNNITSLSQMLKESMNDNFSDTDRQAVEYLNISSQKLKSLVDGILMYTKFTEIDTQMEEEIDFSSLIESTIRMISFEEEVEFNYPRSLPVFQANKTALEQILLNLFTNAVRYNDKKVAKIEIEFTEDADNYYISITDNGAGIPENQFEYIFNIFKTLNKKDRFNAEGTGIGLATVKKLVQKMGGDIWVDSEVGKGTEFSFSIRKNS